MSLKRCSFRRAASFFKEGTNQANFLTKYTIAVQYNKYNQFLFIKEGWRAYLQISFKKSSNEKSIQK